MVRALLLALAATFVACAPESSDSAPAVVVADTVTAEATLSIPVPAAPVLRLTNVNLPAGMLDSAVERWQAATGLQIEIGSAGVPVEIVSDAYAPNGQVCAVTESDLDGPLSVRIDATPPAGHGCRDDAAYTLAHEIGHALCRFYAPIDGECHAASGLMGHRAELGSQLNAATLEKVCEFAPCSTFNPEQE